MLREALMSIKAFNRTCEKAARRLTLTLGADPESHIPMNDRYVINAFVTYLRENGHPGLQVNRWPDNENRDSADIDAIAGAFAIAAGDRGSNLYP